MLPPKPDEKKNNDEKSVGCRYWLSEGHPYGYCRIVGRKHSCHISLAQQPENCAVHKAFEEGLRIGRMGRDFIP